MAEIARTANITGTQGVDLVVKEAPEDALRACQIVGTASIAETPGEALLVNEAVRKLVEAPERLKQLNEIV